MSYTAQVLDHNLELRGATWQPPADTFAAGGLVTSMDNVPWLCAGVSLGPVEIDVRSGLGASEPAGDDWEDVVEISIHADGTTPVQALGPEDDPRNRAVPRIDGFGAGWYRLRIHATGRDRAYDEVVTLPLERYLIQSWPAPRQDHVTRRMSSGTGRQLARARPLPAGPGVRIESSATLPTPAQRAARRKSLHEFLEASLRKNTPQPPEC